MTSSERDSDEAPHPNEPHRPLNGLMNRLRAAVLGANDGIISTAGIVIGVAGTSIERGPIFTAGLAGLTAGAVSMALGEYVSVSSQRDTEKAATKKERIELHEAPTEELAELAALYEAKGLSPATAQRVAEELTAHDALEAHLDAELGIDPEEPTSPAQAAAASVVSFIAGGLLPFLAVLLPPAPWRIGTTVVAVLVALALTATFSARVSDAHLPRVLTRVIVGGGLGMAITFTIGHLFGTAVS